MDIDKTINQRATMKFHCRTVYNCTQWYAIVAIVVGIHYYYSSSIMQQRRETLNFDRIMGRRVGYR